MLDHNEGEAAVQGNRVCDLTGVESPVHANFKDAVVAAEASLANTGQVAGRISEIRPVAEILREVWTGAADVLDQVLGQLR